ncbi:TolC family protein [Hymenobacter sp. YC55]|uniref:TolC family protein n=1 Tax=Hymenobacter sp. YC55 TaxID=3034019 RepID=UPI0023F7B17B|nr:TolC family protein [Hymenobacter sp. YC55]MDF7811659.1 TolC family protein [Hymenobacter sp. YC55]
MKPRFTSRLHPLWAAGCGALLLSNVATAQTTTPAQPPAGTVTAPAASPTAPWTLQSAIDYALQNNLTVRQSQLSSDLNGATLRQSKAALLPTANLSGTQAWNYGTTVNPLTNVFQDQTTRTNNFSGNTQITLFSGFQLRNTVKRNALEFEAGVYDADKARNDLALNVASAFLQTVLAAELLRSNEARVNSSQQQVDRTKLLLKAGSVAESNLLDSEAQLATDQYNVVTAQNQLTIARLQLAQLMNLDAAATRALQISTPQLADPDERSLDDTDPEATYQTAQAQQPDIKAADLRVRSALRNVDVARGGYYPRLFLNASIFTGYSSLYTRPIITGDSVQVPLPVFQFDPATGQPLPTSFVALSPKQPVRSSTSSDFPDQIKNNLGRSVQFALQIPILNGLQVRTNVQRSQIAVKQAELRLDQARLTLRQNIQQAYADALASQRQYISSRQQVQALSAAYRNAEIRFNNGLLNGTEFNIAKNNLTAAESSMIQAKYQFIFRRKVLDFYQGKPIAL